MVPGGKAPDVPHRRPCPAAPPLAFHLFSSWGTLIAGRGDWSHTSGPVDQAVLAHETDMARNIELKARVDGIAELARKVATIASSSRTEIVQDDTFFECDAGRLKLRAFPDGRGELIYYRRSDVPGPKESFYLISPTPSPDSLREILTHALGQCGRVEKRRTLFLIGRTRVHLDQVKGLGEFLELEVVLKDGELIEAGIAEAHELMKELGIDPSQLVEGAYVDLLSKAATPQKRSEGIS